MTTIKDYKFRGGIWIGWLWANTWPSGLLEFNKNTLVLSDQLLRQAFKFDRAEVTKIELKKFFPIIGYGIRIKHSNKKYDKRLFFWYVGFRFKKMTDALEECGWMD